MNWFTYHLVYAKNLGIQELIFVVQMMCFKVLISISAVSMMTRNELSKV